MAGAVSVELRGGAAQSDRQRNAVDRFDLQQGRGQSAQDRIVGFHRHPIAGTQSEALVAAKRFQRQNGTAAAGDDWEGHTAIVA